MSRAVEWGIGLGLVVAMIILILPSGRDDFTTVLRPAGRAQDPYAVARYFYPAWNAWVLRVLALWPRSVALIIIWISNVVAGLAVCRVWKTPAWLLLVSPPFFTGMLFAHPFEAIFVVGFTLAVIGWERQHWELVGLGLTLMLFKPQLALGPLILVSLALLRTRVMRRAFLVPVIMVVMATLADWAWTGQLWIGPFLAASQGLPQSVWNASLWRWFSEFSLLWLPAALWLLRQAQGHCRRELWLVLALGFLVTPYWCHYSLWPVVATLGCWRR